MNDMQSNLFNSSPFDQSPRRLIQLRDYQQEAVSVAIRHFKSGEPPAILQLPTGAGKSVVIAEIIRRLGSNSRVLILQPSREILKQNYDKLVSDNLLPKNDVGIYAGSFNQKDIFRVTYAMINSIYKVPQLFRDFHYLIIDECHACNAKNEDGMYTKFINTLNIRVIGLTATPYRLHASRTWRTQIKMLNRTNPKLFHKIIFNMNVRYLIRNNYLCPLRYVACYQNHMTLQMGTSDFKEDSVNQYYIPKMRDIITSMLHFIPQCKSVLIFATTIELCTLMARAFENYGYIAEAISSKNTTKDRDQILANFKNGRTKILINVGILTTGFDYPELDCIMLMRPTMSVSLYYQMVGRGLRRSDDKKECLIIDYGNNVKRFGYAEDLTIEKGPTGLDMLFGKDDRGAKKQLSNVPF